MAINIKPPIPSGYFSIRKLAEYWEKSISYVLACYGQIPFYRILSADYYELYDRDAIKEQFRKELKEENPSTGFLEYTRIIEDFENIEANWLYVHHDDIKAFELKVNNLSIFLSEVNAELGIQQQKPTPIIGNTQLVPYLELDTWKPDAACLLVSGIDPKFILSHDEGTGKDRVIVCKSMLELFNERRTFTQGDLFKDADRALELWNARKNKPSEITPIDFVKWCKTKDINTDWITSADEWPGYVLSQTEAEALPDAGAGNDDTEPASTKVIQANSNDLGFSGLLNELTKKDGWFSVIDDMTRAFYTACEKMPNEHQAWATLWTNPPNGYGITVGTDKGEDCLNMPGAKPLSKSAFSKRWTNYTANKTQ